jgi:hypothetical protein
VESRFVFWFNGNGIPERCRMQEGTGTEFALSPCLAPLASFKNGIHVLTGLDIPVATIPGTGNDHHKAISGIVSCTPFTGYGAGGASIVQVIASKIGTDSRFRSIQIGVSPESFGESIQRNMSWAGFDRPLAPEMLPNKLFDRLFGAREQGWVNRRRSVLDTVCKGSPALKKEILKDGYDRVDEQPPPSAILSAPSPDCPPNTASWKRRNTTAIRRTGRKSPGCRVTFSPTRW